LEFEEIYNNTETLLRSSGFAVVAGEFKSRNLFYFAKYASQLKGAYAEVGTYAGGTARIITEAAPEKKFYTFDSFEGIKRIDKKFDRPHFKDAFDHDGLEKTAREVLSSCKNVEIIKGWFPNSFHLLDLQNKKFCFVHADADVYPSTKAICEVFFPRLVPGGIIIFDDYGYEDTPGARQAVNEYFADKYETPSILTGGQAVVIKSDDYWLKNV